ncbi:thioredoxin reductase [Rossellomorea marisflavi]
MNQSPQLPVAIIGAGPVGLAAAAHLISYGQPFVLLEAGEAVGANIKTWEHIRLFSPWRYNMDKKSVELLKRQGWQEPDLEALPTGRELVDDYLIPLSETVEIKPHLKLNTKVLSISKKERDKMKTAGRDDVPFVLYVEQAGEVSKLEAQAVIDATGTWGNPNPANSDGVWLPGERHVRDRSFYGMPDVTGKHRGRYSGKTVAVVGSGHSAINAILELSALKDASPETGIIWIIRKDRVSDAYGGEEKDALAARGELGSRIHRLVDAGIVHVYEGFKIEQVRSADDGTLVIKDATTEINGVDEMIVNTGNRPDRSIFSELRTAIDEATESVKALAPLIDPNVHSCGTVRPHGEKELRQPEKNFYIVGAKSYGRAPTFLMATGYEQVRSVVAHLNRDEAPASKVELELPETGVCSVTYAKPASTCGTASSCS